MNEKPAQTTPCKTNISDFVVQTWQRQSFTCTAIGSLLVICSEFPDEYCSLDTQRLRGLASSAAAAAAVVAAAEADADAAIL